MEINWLDGKSDEGMFVLEISFKNGSRGFVKNKSLDMIDNYKKIFKNHPDILEMKVNHPAISEAA